MNKYENLCRKLHPEAYIVLYNVLSHEELANLDEIVGTSRWDSEKLDLENEPNAAKAVTNGFAWSESKQGHGYWEDIHNRLEKHYASNATKPEPTCNCYATPVSSLYEVIPAKCMYKSLDGDFHDDLTAAANASREYLLDKAESKFIRAFVRTPTLSEFAKQNREHIEAYYKELDRIEAME